MKNLNRLLDLAKIVLNEIFDYLVSYFGVKKIFVQRNFSENHKQTQRIHSWRGRDLI